MNGALGALADPTVERRVTETTGTSDAVGIVARGDPSDGINEGGILGRGA